MYKQFLHTVVYLTVLVLVIPTLPVQANPLTNTPPLVTPSTPTRMDIHELERPMMEVELPERIVQRRLPTAQPQLSGGPVINSIEQVLTSLPAGQITQTQAATFNCTDTAVTGIPQLECEALVALYNSTNGAGWTNATNWLSSNEIGIWNGVTVTDSHVTSLSLSYNNLIGIFPQDLVNLSSLQYLDFNWNQLSGSIPTNLSNLTNLTLLSLQDHLLTGQIPPELGKFTNLRGLNLGDNQLSGSIPTEFGKLTELTSLYLGENQLTGSIPSELGDLTNLFDLYLGFNQLSGIIPPELGKLIHLGQLNLNNNQLIGSIPPNLGNLVNLERFYLNDNLLTGTIPDSLSNLVKLSDLDLSNNRLTGSIPKTLTGLVNLCEADNQIYPCYGQWGLNLSYNFLDIQDYPQELVDFLDIKDPDWASTQLSAFTGCASVSVIPLGECEALLALYNSTNGTNWTNHSNWFENNHPATWNGLQFRDGHIVALYLPSNNLEGNLTPDLGNLPELRFVDLSNNLLSGTIPSNLGNLTSLDYLNISSNQLSGSILWQLGSLLTLRSLYLSSNNLTGSIPQELGNLVNLNRLHLSHNSLSGDVPISFTNLVNLCVPSSENYYCGGMEGLDLGYNHLNVPAPEPQASFLAIHDPDWYQTQSSPASFDCTTVKDVPQQECEALVALYKSTGGAGWTNNQNWLTSTEVMSWYGLEWFFSSDGNNINASITGIILPSNNLSGTIPPELSNLSNLQYLRLVNNELTGTIAPELGKLTNLIGLYFSDTLLSGSIPLSFTNLTHLTYFYFYKTNLCEPSDSTFQAWKLTFGEYYVGNGKICSNNIYLPVITK